MTGIKKKNSLFIRISVAVILALTSLAIVVSALPDEANAKEIDISDAAMKKLEDEIAALNKKDKELKAKIASATQGIEDQLQLKSLLDEQIAVTESKIQKKQELIYVYQNELIIYSNMIVDLEADVEDKYQMALEILRIAYEDSNYSHLEIILGAKDFSDFIMSVERVGCMLEYQKSIMEDLNYQVATIAEVKAITETWLAESERLKIELANEEKDLEQQKVDADKLIKSLQSTKATAAATIDSNKEAREEFDKMIKEILEERQRQLNAKYVGGDLGWPLDAKYTRISSGYGWRSYDNSVHRGLDIPADYGAAVYASAAGEVVQATEHWSYGNYVLIDHGGGIATLYAHNSSLLVKAGDKVTKGQQIAKCGSTGQSSGNHVHYEIRVNGVIKNPLDGEEPSVIKPGS